MNAKRNSTMVDDIAHYLTVAQKRACKHNFDDRLTFCHAAILVSGRSIIATGYNYLHVTDLRFDRLKAVMAGRLQNENHAEVAAIYRARRKHDVRGMDMYVVRVHANGELAQSRPCTLCEHVMYNYGIKRVYYSISESEFGVMKLQNPAEKFFRVASSR
jgi:tRNA(Arg) A34 adenosine deaminase TadA